ncbi:hypothetical protein J4467_03025, partial [Candidatus Woesearchaeota archaeon]|nr:hypothetical protein [Candidatus Woesearchaeota archaeon]
GMGKSLLYFLGINIFMSFIASIILLFGSMLLETSLFTDGKEYVIKKIVATWKDEKGSLFIIPPCGSCRQMMRETDPKNLETEVILDKNKVIKLKELLPYWDWWKKQ